jgi:ribonuclease HII
MLTPKQRERLDAEIREHAIAWSIAEVSAEQIDKINIFQATKLAMTRAIKALNPQPDFLLIDSLKLPLPQRQLAITHGDVVSISIAAASIVAKVHRDHQMINEIDQQFPGYGFADHKGYGTPQHLKALFELGPCPIHRMSFRPVREAAAAKQDRLDKTKGAFAGA